MKPIISNTSCMVSDGAWGTELLNMGVNAGGCPEEWNLTHPDKISSVASAYVEAGSQVILTNTFGANTNILERYGLLEQLAQINRRGAEISRQAAGDSVLVFGSIGPFGRLLSMEEADDDEVSGSITAQAAALLAGGVDGIALETMTDLAELVLAIKAVKALSDLPVVASMSYDSGPAKQCTMMGVTPEEAAAGCVAAGADIIGSNCGLGVDNSIRICEELRRHTTLPLWIKANAGFPELLGDRVVYSMDANGFADFAPLLVKAGANIIGGCCGTDSDHIRAIRRQLGM
ncbi:MAG: homocysteine S-methyltransferase family protein [Lentisphaerae bacterium]|nr:homocysteine S-methyltransferase family protein [Lentisphaerota bacterium]